MSAGSKSPISNGSKQGRLKINFSEFEPEFIEKIHQVDYHPLRTLGEGTYGKVIEVVEYHGPDSLAKILAKNNTFAMKLMEYDINGQQITTNSSFTEAYFTMMFRHPNIAGRRDFGFIEEEYTYYVMDIADGDLAGKVGTLSVDKIYEYAHNLSDAVHYIHRGGFIHCDIKSSNVLLFNGVAKLSDLGFLRIEENTVGSAFPSTVCQTIKYRAPELYTRDELPLKSYDKLFQGRVFNRIDRAEYWSIGILILDMLYGVPFLTHYGNKKDYGGFHNFLVSMSTGAALGKSSLDLIIETFGQPKDLPLLEVVCRHLLDLDQDKRSIVRFLEDPIFIDRGYGLYRTPFVPPSVSEMYLGSADQLKNHQVVVKWMVEIAIELKLPLFSTMNAIDFYLQQCHGYSRNEYQALAIVSFWMVDQIFVPASGDISIYDLLYLTDYTVKFDQFNDMLKDISTKYDGYPMFESLYFYLPSMELVILGFKRMIKVIEYVNYHSPRYLADMLIADESDDARANRTGRAHVATNRVVNMKEVNDILEPPKLVVRTHSRLGSHLVTKE